MQTAAGSDRQKCRIFKCVSLHSSLMGCLALTAGPGLNRHCAEWGALGEAVGEEQVAIVADLGQLRRQARHQDARACVHEQQACTPGSVS